MICGIGVSCAAHRGGDEALHAFGEIGHDGGHVRHVAAVVFEVDAAGADDAAGEPQAGGLEHRRSCGGRTGR